MKKAFRIISLLLCVAMLFGTLTACGGETTGDADTSSAASDKDDTSSESKGFEGIYFDTDVWVQVPMVSQYILDKGHEGGEGCQAMIYIGYAPSDDRTVKRRCQSAARKIARTAHRDCMRSDKAQERVV